MRTDIPYSSNRNVVYSCKYHLVWCPKYRRRVLVNRVNARLKEIINETALEFQADLIALEVRSDHVQVLVAVEPQFGLHNLLKPLKWRSARLLRQECPKLRSRLLTLWTNSSFVSPGGGAPLAVICYNKSVSS